MDDGLFGLVSAEKQSKTRLKIGPVELPSAPGVFIEVDRAQGVVVTQPERSQVLELLDGLPKLVAWNVT